MQSQIYGNRTSTDQTNEDITILRIKRKRGQEPLEALVIHQQQQQQQQQRRRKIPRGLSGRNSTDSLASEWAASGALKEPQLFAFGESLSEADFYDISKRQALQERLTNLSKWRRDEMDVDDTERSVEDASVTNKRPAEQTDTRQTTFRVIGKREVSLSEETPGDTLTVPAGIRSRIPEVVTASNWHKERQRIKMFDAINEDEFNTVVLGNSRDPYAEVALGTDNESKVVAADPKTADDLVPMVRDYLSFAAGNPEYMYDFYYVKRTSSDMNPNILHAPNVGAVLWVNDINEFMGDSDSSCEEEDEDSNAEDFYRNDYPDEPDTDSGMDEYYYSSGERDDDIVNVAYDSHYDGDSDAYGSRW
ncbi:hypothetical protein COEREDRAFT_85945 [Coemansia reversa NRRL 1564]|uniref:Probable RNA polymerase II nuclear localization protein SLC7A6OS n=1 Tax=Coemansia reversa (strain ATCC 12441 / NRRL 1564) TaxID=763665 RepID=A0A2G5BF75_COERN|nr:hypothetical protein COEREDRAFT_85945 [Coemansia reversa NRRL 1564]|eukprot:PIA17676.1 hypothetical protein COEREDRAFT_85945 [Coemansia reversa NRRL 1564]